MPDDRQRSTATDLRLTQPETQAHLDAFARVLVPLGMTTEPPPPAPAGANVVLDRTARVAAPASASSRDNRSAA